MKPGTLLLQIRVLLRQNLEGNSRAGGWFFQGWVLGILIREAEREQKKKGDDLQQKSFIYWRPLKAQENASMESMEVNLSSSIFHQKNHSSRGSAVQKWIRLGVQLESNVVGLSTTRSHQQTPFVLEQKEKSTTNGVDAFPGSVNREGNIDDR